MGMYNLIHKQNPLSNYLLATLNLTRKDVGRFRDAFISDGKIAVYTRNGGGNRECWEKYSKYEDTELCNCVGCLMKYHIPKHPLYISDKDDDFDYTYATIYFKFPPEYKEELEKLDDGIVFDPDKRWTDKLEELKNISDFPK